jgi:TP901 family phage tail tape measure protein
MSTLSEVLVKYSVDLGDFNKKMKSASDSIQDTGKKMTSVGKTLTAGITLPIVGLGVAAIKMSTDFNASMANVATLIPGNVDRVNELKKSVQSMAIETGKSTSDLTGGLYNVISAFGDTTDTVKILEINAKAAAAGLATTTDAINLTSAVTKGYGDTSAEAVQHVSDLAFQAVKLGQTTFPELSSSIGRVTPLAASLGVSMEELFGVMATGTGVTGGSAEVSTQLRGVLQGLMSPTADMTALLEGLGYSSGQAMLEQLGLQETIETVVQSAESSNTPLQKYISSIEGQTLALALAGPQADVFSEKLSAMTKATGATNEAFKEQTEGINEAGFKWDQLKQKLAVTGQQVGDKLIPVFLDLMDTLQPIIEKVTTGIEKFSDMDSKTQNLTLAAIALAAALPPIIVVAGMLVTAVGALLSPIGLVIAGVGAVIAIGVLLWKNWDMIRAKATAFSATLDEKIGALKYLVFPFTALIDVGNWLADNWGMLDIKAKQKFQSMKISVLSAIESILTSISHFTGIIPIANSKIDEMISKVQTMRQEAEKTQKVLGDTESLRRSSKAYESNTVAVNENALATEEAIDPLRAQRVAQQDETQALKMDTTALSSNTASLGTNTSAKSASTSATKANTKAVIDEYTVMEQLTDKLAIVGKQMDLFRASTDLESESTAYLTKELEFQREKLALVDEQVRKANEAYLASVEAKGKDAEATRELQMELLGLQTQQANLRSEIEKTTESMQSQADKQNELKFEGDKVFQRNGDGALVELGRTGLPTKESNERFKERFPDAPDWLFHTGGSADFGNFGNANRLAPDEVNAVLKKNEWTFTPQQVGQLATSGGGIVVNVTGNNISNDYDIDRIGEQLVSKLRLAGIGI